MLEPFGSSKQRSRPTKRNGLQTKSIQKNSNSGKFRRLALPPALMGWDDLQHYFWRAVGFVYFPTLTDSVPTVAPFFRRAWFSLIRSI